MENIVKAGRINGVPSNKLFQYVIDFDLSSLYPSIIQALNISEDTLRYKATFFDKLRKIENDEFFEDYMSGDNINYGMKYHSFPDISKMYNIIIQNEEVLNQLIPSSAVA